jgi:hypothetical protein
MLAWGIEAAKHQVRWIYPVSEIIFQRKIISDTCPGAPTPVLKMKKPRLAKPIGAGVARHFSSSMRLPCIAESSVTAFNGDT